MFIAPFKDKKETKTISVFYRMLAFHGYLKTENDSTY